MIQIIELIILVFALSIILFLLWLLIYRLIYKNQDFKHISKEEVVTELKVLNIFKVVVKTKRTGSCKDVHRKEK